MTAEWVGAWQEASVCVPVRECESHFRIALDTLEL